MTTAGAPVLDARDLAVRRGGRTVVDGVDLSLAAGEVLVVLGPNGAGKSTLLAALGAGVTPAAGTVERRGRVATLMQTPSLTARSARANVELALAWWGVPRAQRRERATDALRRMRADALADRFAPDLSGGEQRRVHLARAVAVRPDVLLLDEPFDGLDPQAHDALRDDTTDVLRTLGAAVVVVLHDRVDAWAMADRMLVLVDGRVAGIGRPAELLAAPPNRDVATLLGYDGEIVAGGTVRMTRAAHVRLDPGGEVEGTVERVTRTENGNRAHARVDGGSLTCPDPAGTLAPGDMVRLTVDTWVDFGG